MQLWSQGAGDWRQGMQFSGIEMNTYKLVLERKTTKKVLVQQMFGSNLLCQPAKLIQVKPCLRAHTDKKEQKIKYSFDHTVCCFNNELVNMFFRSIH